MSSQINEVKRQIRNLKSVLQTHSDSSEGVEPKISLTKQVQGKLPPSNVNVQPIMDILDSMVEALESINRG